MNEAEDCVGFVLFTDGVEMRSVQQVRDAAMTAGIPPEQVHDIKARNAFIRTVRQMHRTGAVESGSEGVLLDKLRDEEDLLTFQFSKRYIESQGATYSEAAVITFHKATGRIECRVESLRALAENLLVRAQGIFTSADINALVNRVVAKVSKKIKLRDAVYFFAAAQRELVEQIERFYVALGCMVHVLPVASNEKERRNIFGAVVRDIKQNIEAMQTEIAQHQDDKTLTPRIAKARLRELRTELERYKELARSLKFTAAELLDASDEAGQVIIQAAAPLDSLVEMIAQGRKIAPLVGDLLEASDDAPAIQAMGNIRRLQKVAGVDLTREPAVQAGTD